MELAIADLDNKKDVKASRIYAVPYLDLNNLIIPFKTRDAIHRILQG